MNRAKASGEEWTDEPAYAERALAEGHLDPCATAVVFNTGAVQKYVEVLRTDLPRVRRDAVDWEALARHA